MRVEFHIFHNDCSQKEKNNFTLMSYSYIRIIKQSQKKGKEEMASP